MPTYILNIAGQSADQFDAASDDDALRVAQALLEAGPHGDPDDGPAVIAAGVFTADGKYLGNVEIELGAAAPEEEQPVR